MAADPERLRDRRDDIAAASAARRLQRQEDARTLIEQANALTRRSAEDDEAGDEA